MSRQQVQASSRSVSEFMRRVRRRGTAPEMALRRELYRVGVRFRLQAEGLPGRPDIVLPRSKIAVFLDGCFWHGCPEHFVKPRANRVFWLAKIHGNRKRDRRADIELIGLGWKP